MSEQVVKAAQPKWFTDFKAKHSDKFPATSPISETEAASTEEYLKNLHFRVGAIENLLEAHGIVDRGGK